MFFEEIWRGTKSDTLLRTKPAEKVEMGMFQNIIHPCELILK